MVDYTEKGEIIRGSQWPPGGDDLTIRLTRSSGWVGADAWTWKLLFSRTLRGGTPDLALTATNASVAGTLLTLTFKAEDTETAALPAARKDTFHVELQSTDGSGDVGYWDAAQGSARVRDVAGEG